MLRIPVLAVSTAIGLAAAMSFARADTIFEVEHARAMARAGGPISDQDVEYLERYGAQSGTPSWRGRYHGDRYDGYIDRPYRHRTLRAYRY